MEATAASAQRPTVTGFDWKLFAVFFTLTVAALAFQNRDFYFKRPVAAWGDFAANSLAIRNAGELRETRGNYSRWHFNHPGPAIFYVEAAGERVFHRWLGISPAPHNAHVLACMLLAAAAWAASLALLGGYLPRVPLALFWCIGWIHLWATQQAFISPWPPHVFLLPFLCYCVACASVATGRLVHLWLMVPLALLLVHAHVAQALSVAVLGAATLAMGAWRQRLSPQALPLRRRRWLLLCAIPGLLLLLPMLLDPFVSERSNVGAILNHLGLHRADGKTFMESVQYFLAFGRYWGIHDVPPPDFGAVLRAQPWHVVAWATFLLIAVEHALARALGLQGDAHRAYGSFMGALLALAALAAACAIVWGMKINGPMYAFNGFYFYAIYLLVLLLIACAIGERAAAWHEALRPRRFGFLAAVPRWGLWLAAIVVPFALPAQRILSDSPEGNVMAARLGAMAPALDRAGTKVVVAPAILHLHAATLANILEERGYRLAVPRSAEFMFGERFSLDRLGEAHGPIEMWRIDDSALAPPGSLTISEGTSFFKVTNAIDPASGPYDVPFGPRTAGLVIGLASHDPNPWSVGQGADLLIPAKPVQQDVAITFEVSPIAGPKDSRPRRMRVDAPDQPPVTFAVSRRQAVRFTIASDPWNRAVAARGFVVARLTFLDPISPKQCGINDDERPLSIAFHRLRIEAAKP